jgi:uncharacterized protein (TIGR02246 family)
MELFLRKVIQRDEFGLPPAARCAPEAAGRRYTGNDIAVLPRRRRLAGLRRHRFHEIHSGARKMTRPALTLPELRALLSISAAKAGPNEDAIAVRATWEQTFNSGDADKIAALYTKDAMMFGSTAQLFTGTDGVRTYFSKLPAGIKVKMGDQQAIAHGPDLLFSSGFADFTLANGTVLPYRLTLALVKVDGKWLVAQHHGSPVPT